MRLKGLMMTPYLNDDTFQERDWIDSQKMRSLIDVIRILRFKRVVVFADKVHCLTKALNSGKLSRDIKDWMRSLFTMPYEKFGDEDCDFSSDCVGQKRYEVNVVNEGIPLEGKKFAWSFFRGGMLLGIAGSKYGDLFSYEVKERNKDNGLRNKVFISYMATLPRHTQELILKRWLYAYRSANNIECAKNAGLICFPQWHTKHFLARTVDEKILMECTKRGGAFGRNKTDNAAKFLPCIQKDSYAYIHLLSSVLRIAFETQHYTEEEQDRFSVDVGVNIGYANGNKTQVVCLYVTNENCIHIRPFEGKAQITCYDIGRKLYNYI